MSSAKGYRHAAPHTREPNAAPIFRQPPHAGMVKAIILKRVMAQGSTIGMPAQVQLHTIK
jgi:hypothetical protein